jgi:hypothetical protein
MNKLRHLILFMITLSTLLGNPNSLSRSEAKAGWILLFDGDSLFGWIQEGEAQWRALDGVLTAAGAGAGILRTTNFFSDYVLKFESRSSGTADIFIRSTDDHPGYRIPKERSRQGEGAMGVWHNYEVTVTAARAVVKVDGRALGEGMQAPRRVGFINLRKGHGDKVEVRNVKLKPLGLAPIFDGKSLAGWGKVEPTRPAKQPAVWTVQDGRIHVEHGPGQLETEGLYKNFILQVDIRTNAPDPNRHPNSGIFFRGDLHGYTSGYEAQIRNEYKEGNPELPVDFGTGGIYRYQPARKVVSRDNEFFTMTVVAYGRHLATWVDGFQVTDWTDPNPEGTQVSKKQAVLKAGPISLQAHDPGTNLDFQNIRILELPGK